MRTLRLQPLPVALALGLGASAATAQNLQFDNVALSTDTLNLSFGRGAAMVDLDQDGRLDLICADAGEPCQYYRQEADGTFSDAASLWGVVPQAEYEWGVLAADFDNDGDTDLYYANGGFAENDLPGRPFPNRILRNDLGTTGTLTDVTSSSGDGRNPQPTFGASALDYDRDGFLDVFCADRNRTLTLLKNDGGLVFTDVSDAAGVAVFGDWRHSGAADYDVDGWADIGVGRGDGPNALFHNQQDGTFVDRAQEAGVANPNDNFGMVFQDYDNDGLPDIYVAKYQLVPSGPSPVYLNRGDGTFTNVSPGTGMGAHTDMGHESGDLDGDGYPEILMGTGAPSLVQLDYVYRVTPNGPEALKITDISSGSRFNTAGPSRQHGQALGDYDRDGDIDVYCNNGGPDWMPSTAQSNYFWRNRGTANGWIALELEGIRSNKTGVGTVGRATTATGRDVYRTLQVGRGFTNTPDPAMHFGLGTDGGIQQIELRWPSGIVQVLDELAPLTYSAVVETGMLLDSVPTQGQVFRFELAGPAGQLAEIGLSLGTGNSDLIGVNGPLLLDSNVSLLPALVLDASGEASFPIPVPQLPILSGLTVHAQSWIHDAAGTEGQMSQLHSFTL